MDFPKVKDISSKDVLYLDDSKSIQKAVDMMYANDHRNVVVLTKIKNQFGLLKISDIIKLKLQGVDFLKPINSIKFDIIPHIGEDSSIIECLKEIDHINNCLCTVDSENNLTGFITYHDIISGIDPQMMLERRPISEILLTSHIKQALIVTPASEVARMMDNVLYDCVIVDEDVKPIGIVTTKDIMKILGNNEDLTKPISEYMSSPIETIRYDTSIKEALEFIQKKDFKRLIVTNYNDDIIGQITQDELISKVYSKWAENLRDNDIHLREINKLLEARATRYEELSTKDNLTGIYNRSKFEMELRREIERIRRYKTGTFSLVFFDIDFFKKINDTFGHLEGDNALREIAKLVNAHIRTTDTLARWGGEEFVIIMPQTSLSKAKTATDIIRQIVGDTSFSVIGNITCSFGISQYKEDDDAQSIIHRADQAVYNAKNNGRNRVEVME